MKRLYRSRRDRVVGGVCGGMAAYFGVDVLLIRILAIIAAFIGGGGFLAYILMWVLVPVEPGGQGNGEIHEGRRGHTQVALGLVLIVLGLFWGLERLTHWNLGQYFWPGFLIVSGVFILLHRGEGAE